MKRTTILGVTLILLLSSTSFNTIGGDNKSIITVDDNGDADYTSIQNAIYNADDGDTIFVCNGTYSGGISIKKNNISLIGENKESTIIKGGSNCISISDCQNGYLTGFSIQTEGDNGIRITEADGWTIENNIIKAFNVGIWFKSREHSSNKARYNKIIGNIIMDSYRGIRMEYNSEYNTIENNIFNNTRFGICLESSNKNDIIRNDLIDGVRKSISIISGVSNNIKYNNIKSVDFKLEYGSPLLIFVFPIGLPFIIITPVLVKLKDIYSKFNLWRSNYWRNDDYTVLEKIEIKGNARIFVVCLGELAFEANLRISDFDRFPKNEPFDIPMGVNN